MLSYQRFIRVLVGIWSIGVSFVGVFVFLPLLSQGITPTDMVFVGIATFICLFGVFAGSFLMIGRSSTKSLAIFWGAQLITVLTPALSWDLALFAVLRVGVSLDNTSAFLDAAFGAWVQYGLSMPVDSAGSRVALNVIPVFVLTLLVSGKLSNIGPIASSNSPTR
ncbi:MAG: hypothetical protein AAF270_15055 [Pseudomonadota bacterium]